MENASRALMMAAGVLIGLMILSLAVYLITSFGSASAEAHRTNEQNRINEFNTQFTQYEGRQDITIHDIVTVVNLARSNNEEYDLTEQTSNNSNYYITVNAKIASDGYKANMQDLETKDLNEIVTNEISTLSEGSSNLPLYSCTVLISPITERVYQVDFQPIT